MSRKRAQAIIIRDGKMLFEYGNEGDREWRFLLGGGIDEEETIKDAVIREVKEEAGVHGKILFRLSQETRQDHFTFLVDIEEQECEVGSDPEYEDISEKQHLQELVWIPVNTRDNISEEELKYLEILYKDCKKNEYYPKWFEILDDIFNK